MKNKLSILTVSCTNDHLKLLIDSLEKTLPSNIQSELLISWNGSQVCEAETECENLTIRIFEIAPYHFSKNNNELASHASGELLLFINDDIILDEGCLQSTLKTISYFDVGIVSANLRYPNGMVQHAGIYFKDQQPYHRYKHDIRYDDPRVIQTHEVPAVTGAYILIEKSEFEQLKFDEECKVAAQDVILCIDYSNKYGKRIVYVGDATAIHNENATRRKVNQRLTPEEDIARIGAAFKRGWGDDIKLRMVTEKPGWIMHRKAEEIAKRLGSAVINQDFPEANVHYYINYGFLNKRPASGLLVANFTHYDPDKLSDDWYRTAKMVDHCVAVSNSTRNELIESGVSEEKISVIEVGADQHFKPRMTLGIVGRVYKGGRKGEDLVKALLEDEQMFSNVEIVSNSEGWGVPVWNFEDRADFYRAVDYLLVPSLREGGPVPFMEALACGTMSIAPPIGVIPDYPHIPYKTGDVGSLKRAITTLAEEHVERKGRLSRTIEPKNWENWASKHIALFNRLIA